MTPINRTLSLATSLTPPTPANPREGGAAQDFEALLVGHLLQTFREEGSGWMSGGTDSTADTAFSMAEQQLAKTIAAGRGLGIARVIESAMRKPDLNTEITR